MFGIAISLILAAAPPGPQTPTPTPAATPATAFSAGPEAIAPSRSLRLAVYELKADGIDTRTARIVTDALVAELRKLQRVSVVSMDEVKAMLDLEASKQMVGCDDDSCLAEIADSLGVDGLVIGNVTRLGDEAVIGIKRLDQRSAGVVGTATQRLKSADGSEFLAAVGPLVESAFADIPLRAGARRGVDEAIALRLHPPPLPVWVYWTDAIATGATLATGLGVVIMNRVAVADHDQFVAATLETQSPVRGSDVRAKQDVIVGTAVASWVLLGAGLLGGVSLVGLVPFTDWDNLAGSGSTDTGAE
jgi:hypothetical protein